jgi:hypothetical protein
VGPVPACASKNTKKSSSSDAAADTTAGSSAEAGYYKEEYKDGRFYVFGQEKTYDAWNENGHMPYTRTQIGGGPGGRTVVYEIDKKSPAMTDWLERQYAQSLNSGSGASASPSSSSFYSEMKKDGRYYVFGNAKTETSFKSTGHMPYTRTFIGGGPGGATVVLEIDKKDASLADRLQAEFGRRHGALK